MGAAPTATPFGIDNNHFNHFRWSPRSIQRNVEDK
jgi:hypothetical protein